MIEKNKKYTYEELEEIVMEATVKTIDFMEKEINKVTKKNKKHKKNQMVDALDFMVGLQNIAVLGTFNKILFSGKVK